jgi:hypothetical protein
MAANNPARPLWYLWLRGYWGGSRKLWSVAERSEVARKVLGIFPCHPIATLLSLSFINFARWSVLDEVGPTTPGGPHRALKHRYVLFETNFNGDEDEYFEAFSMIVPWGMRGNWLGCYDVPNVKKVGRFINFINKVKFEVPASYCAYPEATTKMIRTAIERERQLNEFKRKRWPSATAFKKDYEAFLTEVQTLRDPREKQHGLKAIWRCGDLRPETGKMSVLARIGSDRGGAVRAELEALRDAGGPLPPTTHVARWMVVDSLDPEAEGNPARPRDEGEHLLFSAWFDGPVESYLTDLDGASRTPGGELTRTIWSHCGFDEARQPFTKYMAHHVVNTGAPLDGYGGYTVEEVTTALDASESLLAFAADNQSLSDNDLFAAWNATYVP